tara:strand:+ start:983 stop:1219 length:237 start_codon:yes stop_codon:yes gene_type:complete
MGETMGFALSRTIVYWGFDCAEDSIPFARSTFSKVLGTSPIFETPSKHKKERKSPTSHPLVLQDRFKISVYVVVKGWH